MALTEPDIKYIREIAVNAASQVSEQVIEKMLKWHTEACPHGKALLASKWGLAGWIVGAACFGTAFGPKIIDALFKLVN